MKKKKPVIELLIIGSEIVSDPSRDSNSHYLTDKLLEEGYPAHFISFVGDVMADIAGSFELAADRADVVLATGGLGPTPDDMTAEAAAKAFGLPLVLDEKVLKQIEEVFRRRNRKMSESNRKQAMIPEGSIPLKNKHGTAPGIYIDFHDTDVYLLPGVPIEMKNIYTDTVLPRITDRYQASAIDVATMNVTGISESALYDTIGSFPGAKDAVRYYPGPEGIVLKIVTTVDSSADAAVLQKKICDTLGDIVFSTKGENLELVVGNLLAEKGLTIAVAESCTGGLIARRLTKIPGSSRYLLFGIVAYSNESKHTILGVDRKLIEVHGAVSADVAAAMSEGVRKISGADIGISTTGIAGPGGGSEKKPVGLMYTGISTDDGTETKKLQFVEDRLINMRRMSQSVLDIVRYHLKKK